MRFLAIAAAALVVTAPLVVVPVAQSPRALAQPIATKSGRLQGLMTGDGAVAVFRGVPFAAPPVGQRRWQPPAPPAAWTGVRLADRFAASCVQNIVPERKPWTYEFMAHTEVSEDCLYLNLWTGASAATERRPVFIWIHGGGNTEGSGSIQTYDGETLARKGLVVITVNYRLGTFGFFTHPELSAESSRGASGNYALLDLVAVLEWVRDNAAAFGGDPTRVTVAGQSAGASNIRALLASPLAKGLFHRAIAQSGLSADSAALRTRQEGEAAGMAFARAKGAASLADLRAMSWENIFEPLPAPAQGTPAIRFTTVVDGYVLPRQIADVFSAGQAHDVPVLTGSNADEGGAVPAPTTTRAQFEAQAKQRYPQIADAFLSLYPTANDTDAKAMANLSARDRSKASSYMWGVNRSRTAKSDTYFYFWTHPLPGPDEAQYGAFHTSEVPYALGTLAHSNRPFTDVDRRIADTMSSYWANFAKTGNPNGASLPRWPSMREQPWMTMNIGSETKALPTVSSEARRAFLERQFAPVVPGR